MKNIYNTFLLLIFINPCFSQKVLNLSWELDQDQKMIITYDLIEEEASTYFNVSFFGEIGADAILPQRKHYRGDTGEFIEAGKGKTIVWDIRKDHPQLKGGLSIKLQVTNVEDSKRAPVITKNPSKIDWLGFASTTSTGLGLVWLGYQSEKEATNLYNTYTRFRNPEDNVYNQLSREQHYKNARSERKKGTLLMAAGGTAVTIGTVLLIRQLIKNKQHRFSIDPKFSKIIDSSSGSEKRIPQVALKYRF